MVLSRAKLVTPAGFEPAYAGLKILYLRPDLVMAC